MKKNNPKWRPFTLRYLTKWKQKHRAPKVIGGNKAKIGNSCAEKHLEKMDDTEQYVVLAKENTVTANISLQI